MKSNYIFLLMALYGFTIATFAQDETTLVKVEEKAPDFTIEMGNGTTKQLSELQGKVVWINFFATWCPPCRKELPHLQKEVYEKFKNRNDFEVLVIGREHDWNEVNKFKADHNYLLPFYPDKNREIFGKYAKQNIPRNFIIDKEGKIAVASSGFNEKEFGEIVAKVEQLLK
jgi:peroxiredoxin